MLWIVHWSGDTPDPRSRIIWAANDTAAFLAAVEENPDIDDHLDSVSVMPYQRFGLFDFLPKTYYEGEEE